MRRTRPTLTAHHTIARTLAASAFAIVAGASCGGGDSTAVVPISALRFSAQPTSVAAGATFSVSVELVGASGTRITSAKDPVTITVLGGAVISGPATVNATSGVAQFDGLSMTVSGASVQLVASSGLLTTSSAAFVVTPGAADLGHSGVSPAPGNVAPNVTTALTFTFRDSFGNPIPNATVAVASNLTGATFTPASGTTTSSGTFASNFKSTAQGNATVTATVGGKALVFATPFVVVDLCPASPMAFPGSVTGNLPSGNCVVAGVPAATYRFSVPTAGGVSVTVTSPMLPGYEITSDPPTENVGIKASQNPSSFEWVMLPGSYQFRISSSTPGAYTATTAVVPANTGCVVRGLATAGSYTGQRLAAGDCTLGVDSSFYDAFIISSSQGCTITLRSTDFDAYLFALDASNVNQGTGNGPAEDDDSGGGPTQTDAQITLTKCTSAGGAVFIAANTYFPQQGAYTLTITFTGGGSIQLTSPGSGAARTGTSLRLPAITALDLARSLRAKSHPKRSR